MREKPGKVAELQETIRLLKKELDERATKLQSECARHAATEKRLVEARGAVAKLKGMHASVLADNARLHGYLDRVREDDRIREGEAGRRPLIERYVEVRGGALVENSAPDTFAAEHWMHRDGEPPKAWHDL